MKKKIRTYFLTAALLLSCGPMIFSGSHRRAEGDLAALAVQQDDPLRGRAARRAARTAASESSDTSAAAAVPIPIPSSASIDTLNMRFDSLALATDSLLARPADTLAAPVREKSGKPFLEDVISGKNKDSLVYDIKNKTVYIYREGDVTYQNMNLKADFMRITMEDKQIYAYGIPDTTGITATRPVFVEGGQTYTMDTIHYNIDSKKALIQGVATQEGEGYLIGRYVKKMQDNTVNIAQGKYTTCDNLDHPHFYLALTRAKLTTDKKVIFGPAYLVMEDVPIYFLGFPFGFFKTPGGRHSGFLIPEYGEEYVKGFFLRNGGYYFAFNDYIDLAARGGFYTLGSWEASGQSSYRRRYRYSGGLNLRFTKNIVGEKGSADYINQNDFQLTWTHTQDPKFRPNSTFSASVNFASSGYSKYGATNLQDRLNTQTNSSISYSKTWPGKPYMFSTNFQHSQNSSTGDYTLTFPSAIFNVSRIFPFKRREALGKERWYEKIAVQYSGNLTNSVTVQESDLFTETMLRDMRNGVQHRIPVSTSLNLFKYINITPSANYTERWYFSKIERNFDESLNRQVADTTYGFFRLWDYNYSVSASTKVYGMFQFGRKFPVQAIRHVMTPTVSMTFTPDFSDPKFGYYRTAQVDSTGRMETYSPFQSGIFGIPGRSRSASMSFGLQNTLEMKVLSKRDTSGVRKVKILDNLGISSSWNFLADSLNLSPFSLTLRTANLFGNFGINISATLDPYELDEQGRRINQFMIRRGKPGRITRTGWSFGYTFNSSKAGVPVSNDITSGGGMTPERAAFLADPRNQHFDPETRRRLMTAAYYDFDVPWTFGFNYSLSYSKPAHVATVTQTLGFNGSVTLTPRWGVTFNGGYDFTSKKLTPGTFTVSRDLHCWDMNFTWIPIGFSRSWHFTIRVKSAVLRDLKWEKRNSMYDNLYSY